MRNRWVVISPATTADLANPAGDLAPGFTDIDSWGAPSAADWPGEPSANPAKDNVKSSDRIRSASLHSIDTRLPDARQESTPSVDSVARSALFSRGRPTADGLRRATGGYRSEPPAFFGARKETLSSIRSHSPSAGVD